MLALGRWRLENHKFEALNFKKKKRRRKKKETCD
jgi:hypothetical protein